MFNRIILIFLFIVNLINGLNRSKHLYETNSTYNLCEDHVHQHICNGNRNISRINMPQLSKNIQEQYLAMKQSKSILVNPMILQPTQSEISSLKVSKIIESINNNCSNPNLAILVAHNNITDKMHVIDGHHRYAACYLMNQSIYTNVIDGDPIDILNELNTFDGVLHRTMEN